MNKIKKLTTIGIFLFIITFMSTCGLTQVFAHETMLDVEYDKCINSSGDGIDEMWYKLDNNTECRHYGHETNTIRYYFEEKSIDGSYTWTTDLSTSEAEEIKTAYANSMKKMEQCLFLRIQ